MNRHTALLFLLITGLLFATGNTALHAQYQTIVTLNKATYLTYEAVEATVTISNRSGSDIVMGGPNGQSWLAFEVMAPSGNAVPAMQTRADDNVIFKSGATISQKVLISNFYTFSEYGTYAVTASVYHPPSQQYYGSNRARAVFTDAKPFWEQSYGVPSDQPNAGQIRRYTLSTLRDTERTWLYVRVLEDKTNLKVNTFSLGTCILVADPQITVDSANKLHVLFMAAPHIYAHVTIDTQGRLEKRRYYKEVETNRPKLVVQADQSIDVGGGEPYDPTAPAAGTGKSKARSVSERPPGL